MLIQPPSAVVACPGLVWTVIRGHARCHARRSGVVIKVRTTICLNWMQAPIILIHKADALSLADLAGSQQRRPGRHAWRQVCRHNH